MDRAEAALRVAEHALEQARLAMQMAADIAAALPPGPPGENGEDGAPGERGERGEPGPPGRDGRGFVHRGTFDPATAYELNDFVMLNGSGWVAVKDNPGQLPGEGWKLAAMRGERGERGKAGDAGRPGRDGKDGSDGISIVGWKRVGYQVTPIMSDGSTGPALDLSAVFEEYHAEVRGT